MPAKSSLFYSFFVSNLFMVIISVAFWQLNIINNLTSLPRAEYLMIGFLVLQWLIGEIFILQKKWETVYYITNSLPIWGLICFSATVFNAISNATTITPEVAFAIIKGAGLGLLINSIGIFLMLWLKKLAYFCGGEHV